MTEPTLLKNWWTFGLRGLIAIIFAIVAFFWPGITFASLVILFGAFAFVDGIFALVSAFTNKERAWYASLFEGIAGIGAGIVTFLWPGITGLVLVYIIGAWAVVTGFFEIFAAINLRKEISGEWLMGLAGALSIIFGVLLFITPVSGAFALTWLIATYALFFGIVLLILSFKLRSRYKLYQKGDQRVDPSEKMQPIR